MDVFAIAPASSRPLWFIAIGFVVLAIVLLALLYTAYSSRCSRVEIENDRIKLVGDFWGREIPVRRLDVSGARIVDLTENTQYSLQRRTFGTGLPGYAAGWFRLRSGEKALVYLTKRQNVVYLPTAEGYSLLLSVEEPDRFIASLNRYAR